MKAKNLAVMLTDIKGFTDKTSRKSREEIKELLTRHNELVLPVIGRFNGNLIKTIGDAFLVTFASSTDAALCGIALNGFDEFLFWKLGQLTAFHNCPYKSHEQLTTAALLAGKRTPRPPAWGAVNNL